LILNWKIISSFRSRKTVLPNLFFSKSFKYACDIWNSASCTHTHKIQIILNQILRMTIGAPCYDRISTIYKDMQLPFVTETLHNAYSRHHFTRTDHYNPLNRYIPQQMSSVRHLRYLKRKLHTDIVILQWWYTVLGRPTTKL
jgi:hypothetical protein